MVNAYGKDLDIFNDKDLFLCNVSGNSIINNWPKKQRYGIRYGYIYNKLSVFFRRYKIDDNDCIYCDN